jgi:hypothetical protein
MHLTSVAVWLLYNWKRVVCQSNTPTTEWRVYSDWQSQSWQECALLEAVLSTYIVLFVFQSTKQKYGRAVDLVKLTF